MELTVYFMRMWCCVMELTVYLLRMLCCVIELTVYMSCENLMLLY